MGNVDRQKAEDICQRRISSALLPALGSIRPFLRERFREDRIEHHFFRRDLHLFGDDGREAFFISEAIRLKLLAHFAPETLDLELLGGQAARRGLQGTP